MHSQISTKFAAVAMALFINSLMMGGVAYLFDGQLHDQSTVTALAATPVPAAVLPLAAA